MEGELIISCKLEMLDFMEFMLPRDRDNMKRHVRPDVKYWLPGNEPKEGQFKQTRSRYINNLNKGSLVYNTSKLAYPIFSSY